MFPLRYIARHLWRSLALRPCGSFLTLLACALAITQLALTVYTLDLARTASFVPVSATSLMAYLKGRPSLASIANLQQDLGRMPGIKQVVFIPRREGLRRMQQWLGTDNPLVADLDADVLPDAFEVRLDRNHLNQAPALSALILKRAEIEDVRYNQGLMGLLAGSYSGIRTAGIIFAVLLTLSLGLLVFLSVRLSMEGRRPELETLTLLGADRIFLYTPYVVEALGLCMAGAVLGCLTAGSLIDALRTHIALFQGVLGVFTLGQAGVVIGASVGLSLAGVGLAIRR